MLNLYLSEEQRLLSDAFGKLLAADSAPERIRAAEATGFDPKLWTKLVEFGVPTMRVAETAGGGGASLLDAALIAEQAGRYRACRNPLSRIGCSLPARRLGR